jgi:hypothetical protein
MTTGHDASTIPPAQTGSLAEQAKSEIEPFVPPWQECLDDVTLPPGGGGRKLPDIPTPCDPKYLTAQGRDLRLDPWIQGIEGTVQENWFYSAELDAVMPYIIYLPPDYETNSRRYPVLYMLHGRGGHRDE